MPASSATQARAKFGQRLGQAQQAPVHVHRRGRAVAEVMSTAGYARLIAKETEIPISPRVQQLLAESMTQRRDVYQALAK